MMWTVARVVPPKKSQISLAVVVGGGVVAFAVAWALAGTCDGAISVHKTHPMAL